MSKNVDFIYIFLFFRLILRITCGIYNFKWEIGYNNLILIAIKY